MVGRSGWWVFFVAFIGVSGFRIGLQNSLMDLVCFEILWNFLRLVGAIYFWRLRVLRVGRKIL